MKAFEEVYERDIKRKELEKLKVEIKSVTDIRKIIAPLLTKNSKISDESSVITTSLEGLHISSDDNSLQKSRINVLTAKVSSPNMRKLLLNGLMIIKNRTDMQLDVADSDGYGGFEPAKIVNSSDQYMWVDTLIKHCLGGERRGMEIVWNLPDGTYVFNPETEELREET